MSRHLLIAAVACMLAVSASAEPGPEKGRVGWHFYDDPPPPAPPAAIAKPAPPVAPAPVVPAAAPPRAPELKTFEEMQRRMDELRNVAIVNPTEENVQRYMQYEQFVSSKASRFADVAQRVAWNHPELDSTQQGRPVSPAAAEVYQQQQVVETSGRLAALAKDHALLFFFRSDCPYCHRFAPILARFQAKYGIRVEAVSLDGAGLPEFPAPRQNNGIAERLGVRQVPAVFLAQPFKGEISTVGYGLLGAGELEQRVVTVAEQKTVAPVDLTPTALRP